MRVVWLVAVFTLGQAQFNLFSGPNYEDSYNMLSDVVGMQDAIGAWGKVIRNMANRNRPQDYTVRPSHVDIEALKAVPKQNGEIINEKLLNLLLPRIKGEPAFTTTTPSTTTSTTTTSTTTTTVPVTTTTEAPTTSKATTTIEEKTTKNTVETPTTTTEVSVEPTTEEITTIPLPKGTVGKDGPQFTVVFRTGDNSLLDEKKAGVEVVETDFNGDKEAEITTTEQHEATTTAPKQTIEKKTTVKTVTSKPEAKKMEQAKSRKEMVATSLAKADNDEIMMKNALKQKDLDDEEYVSTAKWTETTTEPTIEASGEPSEAAETTLLTGESETTKATTVEVTTKKTTAAQKKAEEKKVKQEEKKNTKKEEVKKTDDKPVGKKAEISKKAPKEKTNVLHTSKEVEAQIEREASEILELLNKPTTDKRQELNRKILFEKLKEYLQQHEASTTTLAQVPSTTPSTAATITNKSPSTKTSITTKEPETTKLATVEATTSPSTTESTTTEVIEEKKTFSVKKSLGIPEAEEEELKPAFVQEDVPSSISTTTESSSTTTFIRASSASPGATSGIVYNLNANSNSDTHPQLSNVITPIAGILDGISPILVPLLGTSGQAARARARGVKTYEPTGRDIMADSLGETSLVGFGTQLARELLSPGILKRERQARERAMAAKIEEAKRMRESKSLIATIFDAAQTGPPLQLPIIATPRPQRQNQPVPIPIATTSSSGAPIYVLQPPPGYQGPPPPIPPPPPPGFIPKGFTGSIPDKFAFLSNYNEETTSPALKNDGGFEQTTNTPYVQPEIHTTTPFANDEGFQAGRSGVRSTFREDSGVQFEGNSVGTGNIMMNPDTPSISIAPADESGAIPPATALSGGGFGGGRKPSASFEDVSNNSKTDNSFLISRKKL